MVKQGSIKATVLIENIFAAFEMEEILFELRHHSSGLNCGMWDYTASIVVNFRHNRACLLPDRQQCVSMKSDFLRYAHRLLVAVYITGSFAKPKCPHLVDITWSC